MQATVSLRHFCVYFLRQTKNSDAGSQRKLGFEMDCLWIFFDKLSHGTSITEQERAHLPAGGHLGESYGSKGGKSHERQIKPIVAQEFEANPGQ